MAAATITVLRRAAWRAASSASFAACSAACAASASVWLKATSSTASSSPRVRSMPAAVATRSLSWAELRSPPAPASTATDTDCRSRVPAGVEVLSVALLTALVRVSSVFV